MKLSQILSTIAISMTLSTGGAMAQDAAAGEKVFKKCKSCHQVGPEAKNRTGPALTGVIGRTAGTAEGFKYGASIVAAGDAGLVWDEEKLANYVSDPTVFLQEFLNDPSAKARMNFKLKKEEDRKNVAAYLATF